MRNLLLASVLVFAFSTAAMAQMVMVGDAWARATSPSQSVGGIFLSIHDHGPGDTLISASSPIAANLELHQTVADASGVMKMLPVAALAVAAGAVLDLKPGSYHLMAIGLKQQLKPGETFPVTLVFAKAGAITVTATVGTAGSAGPAERVMDHMHMDGMEGMDHGAMHQH